MKAYIAMKTQSKSSPPGDLPKGVPGIQKNSEKSKGSVRDEVYL